MSPSNLLSTAASLAASVVLVRTVINDLLPHPLRHHLLSSFSHLLSHFSSHLTLVIPQYNGFSANEVFQAAETYLATKISPATRRLCITKKEGEDSLDVTMERGEEILDVFQGVKFKWRLVCHEKHQEVPTPRNFHYRGSVAVSELRSLELIFPRRHKPLAFEAYLPYIINQAKEISNEDKSVKLHTVRWELMHSNMGDLWSSVRLNHPATFETVAMDPELKRHVMEDLERFVRRKEYYKKVGKAWKRGYLLYGPPGTGKSSLVAAMANFLRFDVYDLELTAVGSNSDLRTLLVATANRSILVVEDIDCAIDLEGKKEGEEPPQRRVYRGWGHRTPDDKMTLSGLLNFIDGLWSSCGDERIIVFTTNHKDKLDPALLRPGRMDMHVHMGYCSPAAFAMLLANYYGVDRHRRCPEIQTLIQEVKATPAEIAGELMKSDDVDVALEGLVVFLDKKKTEAIEAKDKASSETEGAEDEDVAKNVIIAV